MTERSSSPQRVPTRRAASASSQPATSGTQPTRRSTRPTDATAAWAATGASSAPATQTKGSGGGSGSGGGKGGTGGKGGKGDQPRWKKILRITGVSALIALFVTIATAAIMLMVVYSKLEVPEAADVALAQSSTVYWSNGTAEMGKVGEVDRQIIDCADLPDYVPQTVVAAEDRSFYTNPGVDLMGTMRALYKTVVLGDKQGGSTITQQYVERYYVGATTTDIPGKIKETLLALKVDSEQTKDQVLCNYMNTIYFGRGAYGIEAAAEEYFGKPAAELTLSEAALIAGVIPAPSAWDPRVSPAKAEQRWNYVLDGMVTTEFITQAERDEQEFPETIEYGTSNTFGGTDGYLLRTALDEAIAHLDVSAEELEMGGYQIITTFRRDDQKSVVKAVNDMPDDAADNLKTAAVTVDAASGAVTGMYGGPDYLQIQRNAATQDVAQAGSTFKPFAMIGALSNGYSLNTSYLSNSDMTIEGFENPVRNYGGTDYGYIDMVTATKYSVNTYYVQLGRDIGPQTVMDTAITAGLPEDTYGLDANPSNVLGSASPTALQMAHAYTTIADGGIEKEPFTVKRIIGPDGEDVYVHQDESQRVFSKDVIADTTYAMQQTVDGGTGRKAAELGRPIAAKTGTSNDNKSAWFAGFTPQIVGIVSMYQVGEDGSVESITPFGGYSDITGGTVPADVWVEMMESILDRFDVVEFPERADVGTELSSSPEPEPSVTASPEPSEEPSESATPEPTETTEPEPVVTPSETTEPEPVVTPSETTEPEPVVTPSETTDPDPGASAGAEPAEEPAAGT
ncbi:transglycosylase domain-containing protein [Demequina mangrovi]|uniref:Membrane carboxypeptidase (Penicillin-binding protein) n=1 Tax=Demequina mangrovi TaxID=1043493 RepID=A0A1H6ZZT0_9MICO|nr:transglycosylase domain-containing protein [Demequina mangrovi]SEJ58166.1 Membrane carboxypeptidase (penicillin-binding protein) [Demequina mangrovi]